MYYIGLFLALSALLHVNEARLQIDHEELSTQVDVSSSYTFCDAPIRKGKVNFPDSLIGRAKASNFEMYSGYINITAAPDYLFYWFFSTQDGNASAPLIIWTNGGPGCTSMEGATTENGPLVLFDIKEACSTGSTTGCDYSNQLSSNPYAWNKHANVLYLDQPRNVGYSFGYGSSSTGSVQAADDFIVFYNEWLNDFPEFLHRPLVIAGESYGGHYIPAWSNAILDYNEDSDADHQINLVGVVIGNGCVNDTVQNTDEFVKFQHAENLIAADSNPRTQSMARSEMTKYLGYTPNYYDYRLQSVKCSGCYGYNYQQWAAWFLRSDVSTALNVCGEAGYDAFEGSAGGCINMNGFDSRDFFDYSGALARTLELDIPVTFYYGKSDTACDYMGGIAMASTISWSGRDGFDKMDMMPMMMAEVEVGQFKSYDGLTFIQVESAGHMVPLDQPVAALYAMNSILDTI